MNVHIFTLDFAVSDTIRTITKGIMIDLKCSAKVHTHNALASLIDIIEGFPEEIDIMVIDIDSVPEKYKSLFTFRQFNVAASIILISESYQRLNSYLLLRPSAYLKKPLDINLFSKCLIHTAHEIKSMARYFPVKINHSLERIPYSHIDFFESNQRYISLHLNQRNTIHTFIAKLDDIENKLVNNNFIRCHQSYLINLDNVRSLDKLNRQILFFSGNSVEISKRHLGKTVAAYSLE
jgi:DNA-binding LytR/AlgR family response regulator